MGFKLAKNDGLNLAPLCEADNDWRAGVSKRFPPADDAEQNHNDSDDEEDVDEATQRI
jgi:hypothetical protein